MDAAGLRVACISQIRTSPRLGRSEATLSGCGKTRRVPGVEQAFRFQVHLAAGDVNVNERRIRDDDALAGFEPRDVEGGVAVPDPDRRLVPVPGHPGRHHRQPAPQVGRVQLELLISGRNLWLIRHDPHLNQVKRLVGAGIIGRAVVPLRVPDASSGGHALGQIRIDQAGVAR